MPNLKPQIRTILNKHSYLNFLGHEIINMEDDLEKIVNEINNMIQEKIKPPTKRKNHG